MANFRNEEGGFDGPLTFDEACSHVSGLKLQGPEARPLKNDHKIGDIDIGDLPVRQLESSTAKIEQFVDMLMHHQLEVTDSIFESLYNTCYQGKYSQLPQPFCLQQEPTVPCTIQFIILPANPPSDGDATAKYAHIFKYIYLDENKISSKDAISMWFREPTPFRLGQSNQGRLSRVELHARSSCWKATSTLAHQAQK